MKDTSPELRAVYASEVAILASLWRVRRKDGVELGFTDFDQDIVYDGVTYKAATGFSRTALETQDGLNVDNMDVQGLLNSVDITREDIEAGLYRGAQVWYAELDPTQPELGIQKYDYGVIGRVTLQDDMFEAELRSLTALLNQEIGDKYTRYCPYKLGSSLIRNGVETQCGIVIEPPVWSAGQSVERMTTRRSATYDGRRYVCTTAGVTGPVEPPWSSTIGGTTVDGTAVWTTFDAYMRESEVTVVTEDRQLFVATDLGRPEHDLRGGVLTFTTGLNAGAELQVKTNGADGTVLLLFPSPFTISPGDKFKVSVGCNHLLRMPDDEWDAPYTGDCRVKFRPEAGGNAINFGGECEIPGNDAALNIT